MQNIVVERNTYHIHHNTLSRTERTTPHGMSSVQEGVSVKRGLMCNNSALGINYHQNKGTTGDMDRKFNLENPWSRITAGHT